MYCHDSVTIKLFYSLPVGIEQPFIKRKEIISQVLTQTPIREIRYQDIQIAAKFARRLSNSDA